MSCYICERKENSRVKGIVRDIPELKILKCTNCGLVYLENFNHIDKDYYKNAGMNDYGSLEEYAKSCIDNDLWRIEKYKSLFRTKTILDFGSGLGGFIKGMLQHTSIYGCEIDPSWQNVNSSIGAWMYDNIEEIPDNYFDYITLFHVLEHLKDPKEVLKKLKPKLKKSGTIIVEVPNADDALLTLYDCEAFQNFTYWSCHLYLFNQYNLMRLIEQSGLKCSNIIQAQRYPLSNHMYWLAKGKPGGHKIWNCLDYNESNEWYENKLAKIGKCDTLVALVKV
ncbi:hypothetical protein LCGC14_1792720 [marine sediment metagenome]|uniref:Methyltransferase type 11 domain-containing protein n=1 Tax=marine sediment metagenome TaxID=412755 RepID=A0A0F9GS13_9ZZZZ